MGLRPPSLAPSPPNVNAGAPVAMGDRPSGPSGVSSVIFPTPVRDMLFRMAATCSMWGLRGPGDDAAGDGSAIVCWFKGRVDGDGLARVVMVWLCPGELGGMEDEKCVARGVPRQDR